MGMSRGNCKAATRRSGLPEGVMHTTAGYLLGTAATGKNVFDIRDGDKFFCSGDVGVMQSRYWQRQPLRGKLYTLQEEPLRITRETQEVLVVGLAWVEPDGEAC